MRLAVFDLCGTLVSCNTLFTFVRWACPHSWRVRWADGAFVRFYDSLRPERQFRRKLFLRELARFDERELSYLARAFVRRELPRFARPTACAALGRLQQNGWRTLMLSAAPDFLAREAARYFHFYDWRASAYHNGRLTVDLTGKKQEALCEFSPFERLFVATDNRADCALLAAADERMIFASRHKNWWQKRFPNDRLYE